MSNKTIGEIICSLRKEKAMTQNDLAQKMNVTDKAVSKWERNLSYPDINSIPKLAQVLDISVEELLNAQKKETIQSDKINQIVNLVLKAVGLAMGVCIIVTSILKQIDMYSAFTMVGIGLTCFGIYFIKDSDNKSL